MMQGNLPSYQTIQRGVMSGVMRGVCSSRHLASAPPGGDGSLQDVVASCVFDLDATIIDSYDGSAQTWLNLVTAPSDGSAQSDYDFYLGTTSGSEGVDPVFTGTPGDSGAYFLADSTTDTFTLASGANTVFLRDLHKTTGGSDFWFALALRPVAASAQSFCGNQSSTINQGIRFGASSSEIPQLLQRGNTASPTANFSGAFTGGTDYVMICSHSHSTNETTFWINSGTGYAVSHTFNTTTTDATAIFTILDSSSVTVVNTRLYAASMGNAYLDDTGAAAIISEYNTRHGRTYA